MINNKDKLEKNKNKLLKTKKEIDNEKFDKQQKIELNNQENYIKEQLKKQQDSLEKEKKKEIANIDKQIKDKVETNTEKQLSINKAINKIKDNILKKTNIENEGDSKINRIKKNNECAVKRFDCLANNKDIYTVYKEDYKYLKNWSFNEKDKYYNKTKPLCRPDKECNLCPMPSSGIPNSVMVGNVENESLEKTVEYDLSLPLCPYQTCNECNDNSKYILFHDAYDKKTLEKYKKGY